MSRQDDLTLQPHTQTQLIHGPALRDGDSGATALPVFLSTAFAYDSAEELEAVFAGREAGYLYTRLGNPTLDGFERRMQTLEGGVAAVSCASGMAAISATVLALAGHGEEVISGSSLFGGTYSLLAHTLSRCGISTSFVESTQPDAYSSAITDRTRLMFVETIGNPKLDVPDLRELGRLSRERGIVLVVDNTCAPTLLRPGDMGAGIVIHSTSKYVNGHGTAIGGVIVDCGTFDWNSPRYPHLETYVRRYGHFAFTAALRQWIWRDLGGCLSPFSAFLMSTGIESLALRMERHCANAVTVAEHLRGHPSADDVRYPGLSDHADHAVASAQFGGRYGALVTFRLGSKERCYRFMNTLQWAKRLANLGDVRTLVIHPASTICRDASAQQREAMGVTDDLVRLSIGLEHTDDLVNDIDRGLAACE